MKKKSNKSLFFIIAVISIVLIITVIVLLNLGNKTKAAVAADDIKRGTIINKDNVKDYISIKNISKDEENTEELFDAEKLDDMTGSLIITRDIYAEEKINSTDLIPYTDPALLMDEPVIIGIKANDSSEFVSGIIRKGDHINISVVNRMTGECESVIENVYVCGAYNSDGSETEDDGCAMLINILVEKQLEKDINEKLQQGTVRISIIGSDGIE